jgi:transcription termination factor 2
MVSNDSFDNSILHKMSSTLSPKEILLDEAAGGSSPEKMKVSRAQYESAVAEKEKLEHTTNTMIKLCEKNGSLPDGGIKLKIRIQKFLEEIEEKKKLIDLMEVDESMSMKNEIARSFNSNVSSPHISIDDSSDDVIPVYKKINDVKPVHFGKVGMQNFQNQKALTIEKLEDIHQTIDERPNETELAEPPKYLKTDLMSHQLHAIKFMLWREKKQPRGGILADDMGLGKTLTTLSLIAKHIQCSEEDGDESSGGEDDDEDNDDGGWKARGRKDLKQGGKLT